MTLDSRWRIQGKKKQSGDKGEGLGSQKEEMEGEGMEEPKKGWEGWVETQQREDGHGRRKNKSRIWNEGSDDDGWGEYGEGDRAGGRHDSDGKSAC